MNPSGLHEAIDRVAAEIGWGKKETSQDPNKAIGKGFACFWKAPAMPPNAASAAFIKFNEDGSLNISVSGMEIGQGYLTVMAQIAAEVLTVPVRKIRVETAGHRPQRLRVADRRLARDLGLRQRRQSRRARRAREDVRAGRAGAWA